MWPFSKGAGSKKQLQAQLEEQKKHQQAQAEAYEARLKAVVEENMRMAVELNVARAGYKDAAELMMASQTRIRDLERYLEGERTRVNSLETQLTAQRAASHAALALAKAQQEASAIDLQMQHLVKTLTDGTRFEVESYTPPQGVSLPPEEEQGARGVMQRIFRLRSGGAQ